MVKIITTNEHIIFQGHADTKQECETISLMCEQLKNSEAFKTIKYESGYAEFEKVGTTNDLKFEYVPNPTPDITDLTGTSWVFNDECFPDSATSYNINFTSNDVSFKTLLLVDAKLPDGNYIYYCRGATQTEVWNGLDFWTNEAYKTITITGGTGATNTDLISWLQANAILQETPTTDTKPVYKRINSEWVKQLAFERVNGEWVKISSKEEPTPTEDSFITFTGESSDFTLTATNKEWDGTVEYSTDKTTWTVWDGTAISSNNQKLYLRGSGNTTFYTSKGARFVLSALAGCSGNLNTLLEYSNPPITLNSKCYYWMFGDCTSLTTAPALPATTLASYCYSYMFKGCTSLTTAPELPATTLADNCYNSMFQGCTNLTTVPQLPATTLADCCYSYMFNNCTSLTTAPVLPATTLAQYCYSDMFSSCGITTAPELPATTLASYCYQNMFMSSSLTIPPALPATTLASYCYISMFDSCTSLTTAPKLPATTLADWCYSSMFYGCTNLTTAPELPATKLAYNCYSYMFGTCTSLKTAPAALPATTLASYCYSYMFDSCTSLTTAPELPATTLADCCYSYMFKGCTSLTTAPALPATTLKRYCYNSMFDRCTSLTTLPALPATKLADNCYDSMFYKCTSLAISATKTSPYNYEWRIPKSGTISSKPIDWNASMLERTGGTFTSNPSANTKYYVVNQPA